MDDAFFASGDRECGTARLEQEVATFDGALIADVRPRRALLAKEEMAWKVDLIRFRALVPGETSFSRLPGSSQLFGRAALLQR